MTYIGAYLFHMIESYFKLGFTVGLQWTNADIAAIFQPLSSVIGLIIGIVWGIEKCTILKGTKFFEYIGKI